MKEFFFFFIVYDFFRTFWLFTGNEAQIKILPLVLKSCCSDSWWL